MRKLEICGSYTFQKNRIRNMGKILLPVRYLRSEKIYDIWALHDCLPRLSLRHTKKRKKFLDGFLRKMGKSDLVWEKTTFWAYTWM